MKWFQQILCTHKQKKPHEHIKGLMHNISRSHGPGAPPRVYFHRLYWQLFPQNSKQNKAKISNILRRFGFCCCCRSLLRHTVSYKRAMAESFVDAWLLKHSTALTCSAEFTKCVSLRLSSWMLLSWFSLPINNLSESIYNFLHPSLSCFCQKLKRNRRQSVTV